ncbi:MAG: hypothetical protein AAF432_09230 [Planctomycetota bacterium]
MAFLTELWLPIVLSAVGVFIASMVIHMFLPVHRKDWGKMDAEAPVLESLRANGVKPGRYMFPACEDWKDWNTPEMAEKIKQGPVGWLLIMPGPWNMGKSMSTWFLYTIIVTTLTAYVAWFALEPGAEYLRVFQITATTAAMAFAIGNMPDSIWKGVSWKVTFKFIIDGIIYALLTAGLFAWLWPEAVTVAT